MRSYACGHEQWPGVSLQLAVMRKPKRLEHAINTECASNASTVNLPGLHAQTPDASWFSSRSFIQNE